MLGRVNNERVFDLLTKLSSQPDESNPGHVREGFGMTSEEFGGTTAQTQAEVDQDGQGETDTGSTSDQEDA